MLAGIGAVAMESAHASMALQQVAESVTGTGLVHFTLQDMTLGSQVKQVKTWVSKAGTNEWIEHPPVHDGTREMVLSALGDLSWLVSLRNRVVHDVWEAVPTDEQPDAIRGSAAARWGSRSDVETTVASLRLLAGTLYLSACFLSHAGAALVQLHEQSDDRYYRTREMSETERYHRELRDRAEAMRAGTLTGWRWPTSP